jgi:hypothetical protein
VRRSRLGLAAVAVAPLLVVAGPAALADAATPATPIPVAHASVPASLFAAAAKTGTTPVIVVLKSTVGVTSPDTRSNHARHAAALTAAQSPVLSVLKAHRAAKVHPYASFGEVSATVDAGTLTALATDPAVASVVPDAAIAITDPTASLRTALGAAGATATTSGSGVTLPTGTCSTKKADPQLNPEALQTTHTDSDDPTAETARSLGATGAGVKVAFFAEGIDVDNPDFIRPDGSKVFIDYQDFSGDGTSAPTSGGEAFLDASSIAAQGTQTYNVKGYGDTPPSTNCYIRIEGISPGASLVGLKVFGNDSETTSDLLQAVDYAVNTDHVDILSQSLGSNDYPDTVVDAFRAADAAAVASGVTVVASSGDAGITNTIGSPATQPGVIAAGATTTLRAYLQSGDYLHVPAVTGYVDDNISSFSSSGEDEAGTTVSLVAPGDENWVVCTPDLKMYADCADAKGKATKFETSGGTSESAPLIAGGAALVIEAYRDTHGGDSPTPAQVQEVLLSTADDINAPADQQGTGELDTYRAVLAARALPGSTTKPAGNTFVSNTGQIDVAAAPGTAVSKTVTLTNTGKASQTITAATRTLGAYASVGSSTVTLSASGPTELMNNGLLDPYTKTTFKVPAGKSRLDASYAYVASSTSDFDARVRMELIDPKGRLVGLSRPQGDGNFGDFQVAAPTAGTWTAYFWTNPGDGSYGPIVFGAKVADYTTWGGVSPSSLTLAPGTSGTVKISATTPAAPGDQASSIVLTSAKAGIATTIPVILRSLASTSGKAASFTGTLTGGNGRASFTGQEAFYQVTVAKGTPELNATVSLADNPDNPFFVSLVDPNGDAVGNATSLFQPSETGSVTPELSATTHALAPTPGVWDVVIVFAPAVSGSALSEPFSVSLDGTLRQATATGLPQSSSQTLAAGKSQVVNVTVKNTSTAPEAYFIDARLLKAATYTLAGLVPNPLTLPSTSYVEAYSVPSDSVELDESLTSSVPVTFDTGAPTGDPDVEADSIGDTAALTYQALPLASGAWGQYAAEIGPFGAVGAPQVSATATATVRTLAFDSTAVSSTGDLWLQSVDPSADLTPVVIQPGASATIPVTITPKGNKGTVVSGVLFVDDLQLPSVFGGADQPQADQETALPYSYTIG